MCEQSHRCIKRSCAIWHRFLSLPKRLFQSRDFITIIDFATNVTVWEREEGEAIIPASLENIEVKYLSMKGFHTSHQKIVKGNAILNILDHRILSNSSDHMTAI